MKNIFKQKIINIVLVILTIIFTALYFKEKSKFPIGLYLCSNGYSDCFITEKFEDIQSCETSSAKEKGNWLCDSTDKQNIKCHEDPDRILYSYCK